MKGEIIMLSKMNHSIKDLTGDQTAIIPMTDEELAAVGGGIGWAAVAGAALYVEALKSAWEFGETLGDWAADNL
jgi:hypothetical protein